MDPIRLNVLVYEDGDVWVAQAIEADIVATAKILEQLPLTIERAIVANRAANAHLGRKGLEGIPPAPAPLRDKFEKAEFGLSDRRRASLRSPDVQRGDMRLSSAA